MAQSSAAPAATEHPLDWQALLCQHQAWLRTVIVGRLGEREGADEVLQEVALAAVRQQAPLADVGKVAAWLYRLAVLQSLLYRRRMGRHRNAVRRLANRGGVSRESAEVDPLERLLATERGNLVRKALTSLPDRDREILLLKYVHDWSYREIAQHLGTSHSAVETRLFRARRRMRELLDAAVPASGVSLLT
jgi:RNA polymerase sigma-70 factor (ECF subfamily)